MTTGADPGSERAQRDALARLRAEAAACLAACAAPEADLVDGALDAALREPLETPEAPPVCDVLEQARADAPAATAALVDAILAAAPLVRWRRSYTREDGVSADFLARSGWFELASPRGPYLNESHRVTIGYWGQGLYYPEHWHAPEELYLVLAGSAVIESDGVGARLRRPGETVRHRPNQRHAALMTPGPLLALAVWRGEALLAKSQFPRNDADRRLAGPRVEP